LGTTIDESEFKVVDLHEGINSTLLILQYRLKAQPGFSAIEVVKAYGQLPLVECYPGQLNQVLMSLLTNAIDALEEAEQQRIHEQPTQPSIMPSTIWISTQVKSENCVQITIADNGLGMIETVRSRVFDPFFTTKPVGQGTGLGLSISHQIVTEKHHGTIRCDSIVGKGTTFVIELPILQTPEPSITLPLSKYG
jgi:two-component system, NtrC family, sensor kinase